jgi:hypothetical protein
LPSDVATTLLRSTILNVCRSWLRAARLHLEDDGPGAVACKHVPSWRLECDRDAGHARRDAAPTIPQSCASKRRCAVGPLGDHRLSACADLAASCQLLHNRCTRRAVH